MPEEVKKLQAQGIITYGAAIEISKINNQETQIDFAVSSAILGQSKHDIRKSIELGGQEMLFDKNDLDMERRKAELKFLASELTNTLEGVQERVNTLLKSNYLLSKFKKDDYLIRKFQSLMKTLEELNS